MAPLYNRYVPPKASAPAQPTSTTSNDSEAQQPAPPGGNQQPIKAVHSAAPGLYARYVPDASAQTKSQPSTDVHEPVATQKRSKKRRRDDEVSVDSPASDAHSGIRDDVPGNPGSKAKGGDLASKKRKKSAYTDPTEQENAEPGLNGTAEEKGKDKRKSEKRSGKQPKDVQRLTPVDGASSHSSTDTTSKRAKHKRLDQDTAQEHMEDSDNTSRSKSHSSVISRYQKSAVKAGPHSQEDVDKQVVEAEEPETNDLVPIPLPPSKENKDRPTWSALPSWLGEPVSVPPDASRSFESMGLSEKSRAVLERKGFTKALPVQAGALPLLLPQPTQHPGDVCVSAATGSGKTMSYVLPIVEQLERMPAPSLRALIIVPTRELVAQVQETCDLFRKDHGLKIGTAVGNRSLKDEQFSLVDCALRYDPRGYQPISDLLDRPLEDEVLDDGILDDEERFLGTENLADVPRDHVPVYFSRIDILIATPGRLVEHIRNTHGFSLANLRWLVIDEADRLLDQSFQEWADTVNSAIGAQIPKTLRDPFAADPLLRGRFTLDIKPPVRKVVLSATMTSDLDKLSLLKLRNPKLLVVQGAPNGSDDATAARGEQAPVAGVLTLPPALEEWAIPVGDGSEKPLYLVSLLHKILGDVTGIASSSKRTGEEQTQISDAAEASDSDDSDASSSVSSSSLSSDSSSSVSSLSSTSASSDPAAPADAPPSDEPAAPATKAPPAVLIFTSTNESTARLHALLAHLLPRLKPLLASLTRGTSAAQTARHLSRLQAGTLRVLIASDRASRGLDVPALTDVVSYDVPRGVGAYVHRVGRTARAGRGGAAWTLTERRGAAWFWHVVARGGPAAAGKGKSRGDEDVRISRAPGQKVRKLRLEGVGEEGLRERYEEALGKLKEDVLGR